MRVERDVDSAEQRAFPAVVGRYQDIVFARQPFDRALPAAKVRDRDLLDSHPLIFLARS
jgi:hypothetical protein